MKHKSLLALWGIVFIVCAGLGFIPEQGGWGQVPLTGAALIFFVPPFWLALKGTEGERKLVGHLAVLSLGITAGMLVLNFWLALGSQTLGTILHILLVILSTPMFPMGNWAVSLFLWACLMILGKKKR